MTGPNLILENSLLKTHALVAGMDEVGRGAFGGPVCVGLCVIDASVGSVPLGLKDSKLLSASARAKLITPIQQWSVATSVGEASAAEVDAHGIVGALRIAGMRALAAVDVKPSVIILDGSHNWLTPPAGDLFTETEPFDAEVIMKVKADMSCASVAGASVVAKEHRDSLMRHLEVQYPGYGWASHVGYGTAAHRAAIEKLGLSDAHRKSWKL
ncbi:MAG: hypothetical protein RIS43_318 [Actinomycetota bacterium]|jgi:ribonuclease HII